MLEVSLKDGYALYILAFLQRVNDLVAENDHKYPICYPKIRAIVNQDNSLLTALHWMLDVQEGNPQKSDNILLLSLCVHGSGKEYRIAKIILHR